MNNRTTNALTLFGLATSVPACYRWTQWIFLQLFKAGLAERKKASVNWCPSCKTVLADEQVIAVECERCSAIAIQLNSSHVL